MGEEISGRYNFLLLFLVLRLSDEEEGEVASWWASPRPPPRPLTKLIIFLADRIKQSSD